jgi:hypothetical protein
MLDILGLMSFPVKQKHLIFIDILSLFYSTYLPSSLKNVCTPCGISKMRQQCLENYRNKQTKNWGHLFPRKSHAINLIKYGLHRRIRGRCYDHNFLRFLTIFGEKIGVFLKNQCYYHKLHILALF